MWVDQETDQRYYPLSHLKEGKAPFDVYNSPLSEFAVMAFDYGYSLSYPKSLVIWEAQFGDFVNGAQIVIDQYLSSAEQKWGLHSGLTLFLPHGYEGQGPEHSSGRMERFLQLSAFDNWQVVNATTPAQLFHVLRRQGLRSPKKPLIIFTPKMLLRHPKCLSPLSAFTTATFEEVLDDPKNLKDVTRILFCTGKIYYMLAEARKRDDTAIIRIEQLYPLNLAKLSKLLEKYPACRHYSWVQEEPENMGAFGYIKPKLEELLQTKIAYIGRAPSASTAVGSYELHSFENQTILKKAFDVS
jgi:2-oxoglutarate dehydrogenase E1 component